MCTKCATTVVCTFDILSVKNQFSVSKITQTVYKNAKVSFKI
jgi:hypothetical protein